MEKFNEEMLKIGQEEMLNILHEIDRICRKHEVKYWLEFETLLGAVRHQGFIPWDDDCDIGMMRSDFKKLRELIPSELSRDFFFQTNETDPKYWRKMAKIRSNKIKMIEYDEMENEGYHQGVYVDIFVYDFYPKWALKIAAVLNACQNVRKMRRKYPKKSLLRNIVNLMCLPVTGFYIFLRGLCRCIFKKYQNNKSDYVGSGMDQSGSLNLIKADKIFPLTKELQFGDKKFFVPNQFEEVLRDIYGDYLTLPKEEDRKSHSKCICYFE